MLECGGNLFDVVSLGVKAALHNTRIPNVNVVFNAENEEADIELTDDHFDFWRLDVTDGVPILISVCKVGHSLLVDPSPEEEQCQKSSLLVGVAGSGAICLVKQQGKGSLDPDTLADMVGVGVKVGKDMNATLLKKLKEEEALDCNTKGFL